MKTAKFPYFPLFFSACRLVKAVVVYNFVTVDLNNGLSVGQLTPGSAAFSKAPRFR